MNMSETAGSSAAMSSSLGGVLPVFQTPFHEDGRIDRDTLMHEIAWLYEQGVDGVVMAMVSEILRLSESERRATAEYVCQCSRTCDTSAAVVISVGAESAYVACELARHAESIGADAIMAAPPVAVAVEEDEIRRYYEQIASAVSAAVIVQDASGYVGRPMSIGMQARLQRDLGEQVWFKPEATPIGPRLTALHEATDGAARIFEGTGGIALVDSYRRGIVGTMPGADLIRGIVALWRALQAGDEQRIYALFTPIAALVSMQNGLDAFLAIEKYLLVRQGVFKHAFVRGPVGYVLDEPTRAEVDRLFALLLEAVESQEAPA